MMVIEVNLSGTFVKVYNGQTITYSEPFTEVKTNFGRKLGGMCWMALWIYLWSLVGMFSLFIPTIIKVLSYSMTPYILASNPNVTATDALTLSKRMTKGHKGKIFVMGLSFIGWQILNGFTFGILGIFYVNPYMMAAFAGQFVELRSLAVASGVINATELDGGEAYSPQYQQQSQYPYSPPQMPYSPEPAPQPYAPPPASPYEPAAPEAPAAPDEAPPAEEIPPSNEENTQDDEDAENKDAEKTDS